MRKTKKYDVLAIGELNVDIIATGLEEMPIPGREILVKDCSVFMGSSTAITASWLAGLGMKVGFSGMIGDDLFGRIVTDSLKKNKVDTDNIMIDAGASTGATISLVSGNDRALVTNPAAIEKFSLKDIDISLLDDTRHVHIGSYFLQTALRDDIALIFREARKRDVTTSLDPGWDVSGSWDGSIIEALRSTDIFFPNETELFHLAGSNDIYDALGSFSRHVGTVIVKRGKRGSIGMQGGIICSAQAYDTGDPADTTGAGDSFDSGYIYGFLNGHDIVKCMQYGNACGSLNAARIGGASACAGIAEVETLIRSENFLLIQNNTEDTFIV